MTPDELEDLAMVSAAQPIGLSASDIWLFQCFRALHASYRYGTITRDQAKKEKVELLKSHELMQYKESLSKKTVDLWKNIELATAAYAEKPCIENADKLLTIIYGISAPRKTEPAKRHITNDRDKE